MKETKKVNTSVLANMVIQTYSDSLCLWMKLRGAKQEKKGVWRSDVN